jgi:uncharacterized membrane protein (UPF0127 family)
MRSRLGMTLLIALLMPACTKPQPAATSPPAAPPEASGPRIAFPDHYAVRVEIAADDETRQQGLMYRDRLPEATGMIFIFAKPDEYPFWMKNTLIPLDMVWIDANHRITHVSSDVPPCKADPCPSYPPNAISSYVLELAAGVAAKHHLANGQELRFEGLDHVIVR